MSNPQNHPAFGHQVAPAPQPAPVAFGPQAVPAGVSVVQWIADQFAAGGIGFQRAGAVFA